MRNYLSAIVAATALAAVMATPAKADIVTMGQLNWDTSGATLLTLDGTPGGGQTTNVPCIICGANQPNQTNVAAGFGYTDFGNTGNLTDLAYFSSGVLRDLVLPQDTISGTNYTGQQIANLLTFLGSPTTEFSIGIDINEAPGKGAQTLEGFFFLDLTSQTIIAAFAPGIGDGVLLPATENGTGHPDYTLNGLTLAGLDLTHEYAFFARISGANDGPDSFFIVPQAVPGPIVGAGIPGLIIGAGTLLALARRRKNKEGLA